MNKKLIIKIEYKLLRIIGAGKTEKTERDSQTSECRAFEFPEQLRKNLKNQPEVLAGFIRNCIKSINPNLKKSTLLFDSKLGFFKEYNYKKNDTKAGDRRFYIEVDNQKHTEESRIIAQRLSYPHKKGSNGMRRGAAYGIDDKYLRVLTGSLKKHGINTDYATSSLIVYKNSIEQNLYLLRDEAGEKKYRRVIGLDLDIDCFRAVITENGKVVHLEESFVPEGAGPEDKNLMDMLTDLLKEYDAKKQDTFVIVSGQESKREAKRLMSYSGITCKSVSTLYSASAQDKDAKNDINDINDIEETFSVSGLDIKKYKDENYLYGGYSKRNFSRATSKICVVAVVILALLFSMLPIYSLYAEKQNEELRKEIEKDRYKEQLKLIYENRDVLSALQTYKDDFAVIDSGEVNYSEVLTILNAEFLAGATINDLFYDGESGLIIDFDVKNVRKYENARDKLNDERKMLIVETSTGPAITSGAGLQNTQIKVTIPKSGGGGN